MILPFKAWRMVHGTWSKRRSTDRLSALCALLLAPEVAA